MPLETEADVVATLAGRAVTLEEIYAACETAEVTGRDRGADVIHGRDDRRWKRRVRGHLQTLKRAGRAQRLAHGTWIIDGTRDRPRRALLVLVPGELGHVELALADASTLLDRLAGDGIEADLVVCDPPWALGRQRRDDPGRDRGERIYARDASKVVGGYVEVDAGAYAEFTARWVAAASKLLRARPGSYLAAVTGPGQAARVQTCAEDAGLEFVNQIVSRRPFALPTTRRFSHAHHVVTVLSTAGSERRRFFAVPDDLPKARSGADYPLDWWDDVPKYERRGLLRYDNALPPLLIDRVLRAYTPGPDNGAGAWQALVVDPFVGSGTTADSCVRLKRRFVGGDANPRSLTFTMSRLSAETLA